jgi:hypothetical protein
LTDMGEKLTNEALDGDAMNPEMLYPVSLPFFLILKAFWNTTGTWNPVLFKD